MESVDNLIEAALFTRFEWRYAFPDDIVHNLVLLPHQHIRVVINSSTTICNSAVCLFCGNIVYSELSPMTFLRAWKKLQ